MHTVLNIIQIQSGLPVDFADLFWQVLAPRCNKPVYIVSIALQENFFTRRLIVSRLLYQTQNESLLMKSNDVYRLKKNIQEFTHQDQMEIVGRIRRRGTNPN